MKGITTILILILSLNCLAQNKPFIGVSFNSIGYSLQGGVIVKNKVFTIGHSVPLTSALNPTLVFGTVGYQFDMGKDYSATPSVGYCLNTTAPIGTIELSKDIYKGRLFIAANYCRVFFAGAGFKIFII
jgi:hypothetical protein